VVVGSLGGSARDPAWVGNLRAELRASVCRGKVKHAVLAGEAEGEERDRLWQLVGSAFPSYKAFQRRTTRIIPLFVLEPPRRR